MPWKGVTMSEQRERFIEDYMLNYYPATDLAERLGISRNTAYTHPGHQGRCIYRFKQHFKPSLLTLRQPQCGSAPRHYPAKDLTNHHLSDMIYDQKLGCIIKKLGNVF